MINRIWTLTEAGPDNLGLACTEDGLLLGRTPLIERRNGRFAVRERGDIERLLKRAYAAQPAVKSFMPGMMTVASALNANDLCLARIAAVHLKMPNLPNFNAREEMEAEDALIKSVDWNPDLHPRTGEPPNPGWFAPTGGSDVRSPQIETAQNDDPAQRSDASPDISPDSVRLPPGQRIDELGDFLEWLANAKPEDEKAIRAEIRRYYYDVGDTVGGNALNAALSDVLEPGISPKSRQDILNSIAPYASSDPAEIAQARNLTVGGILLFSGQPPSAAAIDTPSEAWKLGWAARGVYFSEQLGANLPATFKVIDGFADGVATSIKSIDLSAATYQDAARLSYRINNYIDDLALYEGGRLGVIKIDSDDITGRVLSIAIPKGIMNAAQQAAFEVAAARARAFGIDLTITPF
jgi:hypothetical protein